MEEIEEEIHAYEAYANSFSREQVLKRPLTYAVTPADRDFDFSNIDRLVRARCRRADWCL